MRNLSRVWIVMLLSLVTVVAAKPSLPIALTSRTSGEHRSAVSITFRQPATDVTLTVRSTGTARMQPVTRHIAKVAKGESVEFSPVETEPRSFGGVAVHVQADFGTGQQVQASTITLTQAVKAPGSVRAKSTGEQRSTPGVIILPAKTTVKPLER